MIWVIMVLSRFSGTDLQMIIFNDYYLIMAFIFTNHVKKIVSPVYSMIPHELMHNAYFFLLLDLDECLYPPWNECSENQTCSNSAGTFSCNCKQGFQYDTQTKKCLGKESIYSDTAARHQKGTICFLTQRCYWNCSLGPNSPFAPLRPVFRLHGPFILR